MFLDETGLSQQPVRVRTWAPRGQTPVLIEPFNWKKLSAIIAISTDPRVFFELVPGSVTGLRVLCFLVDLLREFDRPIVVLWDGAPIHRTGDLHDFLRRPDVARHLEVHRFPPYAPELNPKELFNANLKARRLANFAPETLGELDTFARKEIRAIGRNRGLVRSFLLSSRHGLFTEQDLVKLSFDGH